MRWNNYLVFTLIELLIVISIMMILASLLFPALGKAKELGKSIKCRNNLRQLSLESLNYQSDYNEYFIPLKTGLSTTNTEIWGETIYQIYGGSNPSGTLKPGKNSIFNCPSSAASVVSAKYVAYGACYYGAMSWYLYGGTPDQTNWGVSGYPPAKSGLIQIPARTILFADNVYGSVGFYFIKNVSNYYTSFPGRHNGADNIIFTDGHVEQRNALKLNTWLQRGYTVTDIPNHFIYYAQGIPDQD